MHGFQSRESLFPNKSSSREFLLCFSKWHSTKALKGKSYIDRERHEFKQKCRGEKVWTYLGTVRNLAHTGE